LEVTRRAEPLRTCVGCRNRAAKSDLLRIVVERSAAGEIRQLVPDLRGGMPGRGAHLHPDPECLALAERRRAFGRALRVEGPLDLEPVREQINNRSPVRGHENDERSMSQHR
jgi:predicted RNA-binding protein YlxR (DUF448 family)